MRMLKIVGLVALLAVTSAPAFAADSMMSGQSMTMAPGAMMMMKPDGTTMMMPPMTGDMATQDDAMMKSATPMDGCMIMMMGKDGKMMMMHDMKMADGKMACDEMMMMKKK
jgi:hypothetical protein